jgi:hypothetical protein
VATVDMKLGAVRLECPLGSRARMVSRLRSRPRGDSRYLASVRLRLRLPTAGDRNDKPLVGGADLITNELRTVYQLVLVGSLIAALPGCGRQGAEVRPVQNKLGWLGSMYGMYVAENQGRTPRKLDDFKKYIEKRTTAEQLSRLGVSSVEELFTSPRDGKPFQLIAYETLPPREADKDAPIVLYETQGADGRRAIAYLGGATMTVDENVLPQMLPASSAPSR